MPDIGKIASQVSGLDIVLLPFTQAKQALDRLKRLCVGRDLPDAGACARFDRATKDGRDMTAAQNLLGKAVARGARHGLVRKTAWTGTPRKT